MGAVNRPEPILWITLAAIPANALLAYLLIYGELGLPRLGLFGAGLATTIVNFGTLLAGLWFATQRRPFRKYHVLGHIWRIDWTLMRAIDRDRRSDLDLVPAGIRLVLGRRASDGPDQHYRAGRTSGRAAGRGHLFMVPFGIAMAATVRVGHAVGRGDAACGEARGPGRDAARRRAGVGPDAVP